MTKCTDSGDLRQLSPRARWDTPSTFGTPQKKKSRVELCFMRSFFFNFHCRFRALSNIYDGDRLEICLPSMTMAGNYGGKLSIIRPDGT